MRLRILLIVTGLIGFVFTVSKQKPPGSYLFACSIVMIAILGPIVSENKRPGPLKIITAVIVATAAQQLIVGFLASEMNRLWLTLQFLALQTLLIGAMRPPKGFK